MVTLRLGLCTTRTRVFLLHAIWNAMPQINPKADRAVGEYGLGLMNDHAILTKPALDGEFCLMPRQVWQMRGNGSKALATAAMAEFMQRVELGHSGGWWRGGRWSKRQFSAR